MKLEVGMYVRTPYGIDKIKDIVLNGNLYEDSGLYLEMGIKLVCGKEEMKNLKASHNIIDLIEVGDYVNGYMITDFSNEYYDEELDDYVEGFSIVLGNEEQQYSIPPKDIKTVATKEQMEAIQYKVV